MTGTLTSKVSCVDFVTDEHSQLNNSIHLRLHHHLIIIIQHPHLTELERCWRTEECWRWWRGDLDEDDALEMVEESDEFSAVSWLYCW